MRLQPCGAFSRLAHVQTEGCNKCRYDHFKEKPAALLVKMAEFVMAALTDHVNNHVNKQYNDAIHDQHRLPDPQT